MHQNNIIELNMAQGLVKGNKLLGIEQAATLGKKMKIEIDNHVIEVRDCLLEFVYRYPLQKNP